MMKTIESLAELHEAELEMLDAVAQLCAAHGIVWFLHGGTLLGAVRHQGPIPWDDDLDIAMMRGDYERFKQVAHELGPRFALDEPVTHDEFFDFVPRVTDLERCYRASYEDADSFQGRLDHPDADIFVFESACSDPARDRTQSFKLTANYAQALGHRPHIDHTQFHGAQRLASYVLPAVGRTKSLPALIEQRAALAAWGDEGCDTLRIVNDIVPSMGIRYQRSWYEGTRLASYETLELPVPAQAEAELEAVYGPTWRELPPEGDRHPTHAYLG